jgi:hypothetical protein
MSKNIALVLSDVCDHSKSLVPDSGPAYGETMGLEMVQLKDADWSASRLWMIDLRLVEEEFAVVERAIRRHPATTFLLRMVDPYWESATGKINTKVVFQHIATPNVGYVSGYQPEEATALLAEACKVSGKLFICPNAYDKRRELPLDDSWLKRPRKIAFAGAQNPELYLYRAFFRRKIRSDFRWWGKVATLPHPGYADIGEKTTHGIKGDEFIAWMGSHQMCFLCPGRCHLEFIKYRECAYAGCAPVGAAPRTMSDDLAKLIIPIDWNNYKEKRDALLSMPPQALFERARAYREKLSEARSPDLLKRGLVEAVLAWRK